MLEDITEIILVHSREYSSEQGTYYHAASLASIIADYLEGRNE